jgi:hypothetical protein
MKPCQKVAKACPRWGLVVLLTFALDRLVILFLAFAVVAFVLMWWSAWRQGKVPTTWWESGGNHGPWRHLYARWGYAGFRNLRWFWQTIFESLVLASASCLASLLVKTAWKRVWMALLLLGLTGLFFYTHAWLVD